MIEPPRWSPEQLDVQRAQAISIFRTQRLEEPLEDYLQAFDEYHGCVQQLLDITADLTALERAALEVLTNPALQEVFRYLAAPPISSDDLTVLAEAPSLAKGPLTRNPDHVRRLLDVVRTVLDRRRFTWVVEHRQPTDAERDAAVLATTALMAASRVQMKRRMLGKEQQEQRVEDALTAAGLRLVPPRTIPNVTLAPAAGEFCRESVVGSRKADIVVRLWDHRLMPIECKVSNSYLNSVKRLNNDAAVKAGVWLTDFGLRQVVPTAVLSGVYKLHSLEDAQSRGLAIVWAHDLEPLTAWIEKTR